MNLESSSDLDGTGFSDELVEELVLKLGESFDLETVIGQRSLSELIGARLRALRPEGLPRWGGEGSMAQVAAESSEALSFYYRPHLFPDMDPALRLGHQLQFELLPREMSESSPFRVTAVLESYCHLSGDLVGWRESSGRYLLWIADVSGHGVRAGLAAAVLRFILDSVDSELSPSALAGVVNERMQSARNPEDEAALFATACWLQAEESGRLSFASAGHNQALVRRSDGEVEALTATGLPIGLLPGRSYEEREVELGKKDTLLLFTDGVVEARDPNGEEFGLARTVEVLSTLDGPANHVARSVYDAVQEHKGTTLLDDDLTFMVIQAAR